MNGEQAILLDFKPVPEGQRMTTSLMKCCSPKFALSVRTMNAG